MLCYIRLLRQKASLRTPYRIHCNQSKEALMKTLKALLFIVLFSLPSLAFADLTGRWSCNDGGTYYVRQIGKEVFWFGEQNPGQPVWSNTASGYIDGNQIILRWADVPKGSIMQEGILILQTGPFQNHMQSTYKTGGFGGSVWNRI